MGLWMSRLMSLFGDKEARILVLGLDNAGKTTILCKNLAAVHAYLSLFFRAMVELRKCRLTADRLQVGEVVSTIPSEMMRCCPASCHVC